MPWDYILQAMTLPMEVLAAVALFCLPLRRRGSAALWPVWLALCYGLFYAGFSALAPWMGRRLVLVLLYSLGSYLCGLLFALLCCRIAVSEALYAASSAYLTQHMAYCLFTLLEPDSVGRLDFRPGGLYLLVYGLVYLASYRLFARRLPTHGRYDLKVTHSVGMTAGALLVALVFSAFAQQLQPENEYFYRISLLYAVAFCVYALWAQLSQQKRLILRHDLDVQQQLWAQQRAQYETAMQNVDVINQKCHDLKHQIAALRLVADDAQRDSSIRSLEQSVMIYDAIAESGNKILDAVLTEKSLLCEAKGVELTCMADGKCFAFMDAVDLYAMVGNILDNAVESAARLPDPEQRTISFMAFSRAGLAFLQVENYYQGELQFDGALPRSSKPNADYHGFGLKSIQSVAEKYGGFLTVQAEDQIFLLRVTIPCGAAQPGRHGR